MDEAKATPKVESMERFRDQNDPVLSDVAKEVYTQYAGIREQELVPHIRRIRDLAWQEFQYPCVGSYNFAQFSIVDAPRYQEVLTRLRTGNETLLDLGCCFAQDFRKLIYDGVPAANLTGLELKQRFIDLGYELFHDHGKLGSNFVIGDFFTSPALVEGSFDIIHAGSFYHLFDWDTQVKAIMRSLELLKPKAGSMILGRQTGLVQGKVINSLVNKTNIFRHDTETLKKAVAEAVQDTPFKVDVEVSLEWDTPWAGKNNEVGKLVFCILLKSA